MNLPASISARLLNVARERREDYQHLLTRYALGRLLARMSRSEYAGRFILKGALLFGVWTDSPHRPTKDIDLLGAGDASVADMEKVFREMCSIKIEDDGLVFDPKSVRAGEIREGQIYGGIRVSMLALLGKSRIKIQVDVGFGDAVTPDEVTYPSILDFACPKIRAYPPEAVVAEKFHAMTVLGIANSRVKDFYDLWALSRVREFVMEPLAAAVRATFERRGTELLAGLPVALTAVFADDATKIEQWGAFLGRTELDPSPPGLDETVSAIARFVGPVIESLQAPRRPKGTWKPGGPWR